MTPRPKAKNAWFARWPSLQAPVDIASLVAFRIAFGLLMVYEVFRFFETGWIEAHYVTPEFLFAYPGFEWVRPWPGSGMYVHFAALGLFALGIAVGFAYRLCAVGFTIGFAYVFLLDQARYLNHFYLIVLLGILLAIAPAHRAFAVDAWRHPERRTDSVSAFWLTLLRAQLAIVFLFAAIAKMNTDWLAGWPMRLWLVERAETSALAGILEWPPLAVGMSVAGLLFDLLIVPALLWKRTRRLAFAAAVTFHVTNAYLFNIGVFPALGIAATTLFLDPGWPRRLIGMTPRPPQDTQSWRSSSRVIPAPVWVLATLYFTVQILVPLRHWIYPNEVRWTEQGQAFSWRMKLSDKEGRCRFWIEDRERDTRWIVDPRMHVWPWQYRELCTRPEMMTSYARYLDRRLRAVHPGIRFSIGIDGLVAFNGRPPQPLVDPRADLLHESHGAFPNARTLLPLRGKTPPLETRTFGFAAMSR